MKHLAAAIVALLLVGYALPASSHHVRQYRLNDLSSTEYQSLLQWRVYTARQSGQVWYPRSTWLTEGELKAIIRKRMGNQSATWANSPCPSGTSDIQCLIFQLMAGQGERTTVQRRWR